MWSLPTLRLLYISFGDCSYGFFRYWLSNQGDWEKVYTETKQNSSMGICQRHLTKRFDLEKGY